MTANRIAGCNRSGWAGLAGMLAALGGCGPANVIVGQVVDAQTSEPLAGVVISGETGGIYVDNPDKTKGNPAYVFGVITDRKGFFELPVPTPQVVGLHGFLDGYRYAALPVEAAGYAVAQMTAARQLPLDLKPTISDAVLSPTTVAPGGELSIRAVVRAGTQADPLSEEILVVQPRTHFSIALDPPSPGGRPGHWPDGLWSATFRAPNAPGTYDYYLVGTSEGCVNADQVTFSVEVR